MASARRTWHEDGLPGAAAVAGLVLLLIGLAFGRPDVALLGVPVLLGAVIGWTAPSPEPMLVAEDPATEDAVGGVTSGVRVGGGQLAHVRLGAPGHRVTEFVAALPASGQRLFTLELASKRTGPQSTAMADVRGYAGSWTHPPRTVGGSTRLALPAVVPLTRVPVPRRLRGLTGPRVSRRFGDGSELRDVHPFEAGDRLKRIDWRATARRSPQLDTLYVRRTFADAEAAVMLVVDSRDDVGPDLQTWRGFGDRRVDEATSLDLAREAAASIARALIDRGDRVGLVDLARNARPLPPATSGRQLRRVLHGLALAHPVGAPSARVRPPQLPADVGVYLFSTVLDDVAVQLARTWRSIGHPVVLVDTLPSIRSAAQPTLQVAWRIVSLERQVRLDGLARERVSVVVWNGTDPSDAHGSLDALARATARGRDWR